MVEEYELSSANTSKSKPNRLVSLSVTFKGDRPNSFKFLKILGSSFMGEEDAEIVCCFFGDFVGEEAVEVKQTSRETSSESIRTLDQFIKIFDTPPVNDKLQILMRS